jgi:type VI secretion system lysozyme-like protein
MTDLTELVHGFPDSIMEVQRAIRTTIEKFEPRLQNVSVEYVDSGLDLLTLRFKITAQIVSESENETAPVWFETVVEPSGQVGVVKR